MKRVLLGLGGVFLVIVVVFAVLVVFKVQQEAATQAYCDKLIALAKKDKVDLEGGGQRCYARAAFLADQKDPSAKAVWKCNHTCIGPAESYEGLKRCEAACGEKIVAGR